MLITMLRVGDPAPDFELDDHEGQQLRLSSLAGTRVLLWFYPKADTPGCTKEGCAFRDAYQAFDEADVEVLGISFDSAEDNKRFAERYGFRFRLLSDVDRAVGLAYGAADSEDAGYAKRMSFLIGPSGEIEHVWDQVDPQTHPQEVLDRLRQMNA
jgi:peroxiredoxin Q/BCP